MPSPPEDSLVCQTRNGTPESLRCEPFVQAWGWRMKRGGNRGDNCRGPVGRKADGRHAVLIEPGTSSWRDKISAPIKTIYGWQSNF